MHTQSAGRLAVTLQWQPQFAVSGKAWQHKINYCSTLPVNWSNADIPISQAWMLPCGHYYVNLALLLDFPPSAAAEGGGRKQQQQQQQQRISTVVGHRPITKRTTSDTHTSSQINEILTTSTRRHTTTGRDNLIHISRVTTPSLYLESSHINLCCLNTRSAKNKILSISDYVTSHDYDIMCLTEIWLRSDIDAVCISEMVPTGY